MISWNNLNQLEAYKKLSNLNNEVNLQKEMSGDNGATRVQKYSVPMSSGLTYNFAAKQVNDTVLNTLSSLAEEAQLTDKFAALYNGEVINTGEKRLVLHQLILYKHICLLKGYCELFFFHRNSYYQGLLQLLFLQLLWLLF